jgi:peptidase E
MTEKEKAQQLAEKFFDGLNIQNYTTIYSIIQPHIKLALAKQCALIFVNEIIDEWTKEENRLGKVSYWIKVKQEIENYE